MTEIEQNEALAKALREVAEAADVASAALERLNKVGHGGVQLRSTGQFVSITIEGPKAAVVPPVAPEQEA